MNEKIKNKLVKTVCYIGVLIFLVTGFIYKNYRIYLYSSGGIEEDKITFGLTRYLNIQNAPFYELNLFYTTFFISIGILIFIKLIEELNRFTLFNKILIALTVILFLITFIIPIVSYEEIREVDHSLKPYSIRFLSFLDDSIETSYRVRIELTTDEFMIMLYSLILGSILFFIVIIRKRSTETRLNTENLIDN